MTESTKRMELRYKRECPFKLGERVPSGSVDDFGDSVHFYDSIGIVDQIETTWTREPERITTISISTHRKIIDSKL
jgi:hypothetical protein